MSGGQQMLQGNGGAGVIVGLSVATNIIGSTNGAGGTSSGSFTMNTSGSCAGNASPFGAENTFPTSWCLPVGGIPGLFYWVRFTITSGSAFNTGPASGVWTPLSSNVTVSRSGTTGGASTTFDIAIATDAAGTTIVATRAGNIVGFNHAPL